MPHNNKKHSHKFDETEWPFNEPENLAVFSTKRVVDEDHPVNLIAHDKEGDWQFLCGTTTESEDCLILCLGCFYEKFPFIADFKGLEAGWEAYRESEHSDWVIQHIALGLAEEHYVFPRTSVDGYELVVIEQEDVDDYPFRLDSFPSDAERLEVRVGDMVKLIFRYQNSVEQNGKVIDSERMWVEITQNRDGYFIGRLDNVPSATTLIKEGSEIRFHPKHIIEIWQD